MASNRRPRRMPGVTRIPPVITVSKLIDTCVVAPRCAMDATTATRQMASDMREAAYREGGLTHDGLMLLGYSDDQIATLVKPARALADQMASV
ncbi:hypothetical protein ONR75_24215 [Rhodopseudomonas sp. P2A-2r]|uniref:hypothetical protein n=1 Tax=Rhodopseudomonas sp. P2A-2r TaxID=2991972 RepID=UPI002234B975|nr:hypothetical protein [Rhodopseudomonas sp. P2A-2r]UZE47945.1 hypothetical protein ONR75_24215 [Rhodopseudomonas sp. P2A-2r]